MNKNESKSIDYHFISFFILSFSYLLYYAFYDWIPHDEGALAHSAERVLNGEIPHLDYYDVYTGLQAYLHALFFKLFGAKLTSLRICLLFFSSIFIIFTYKLLRLWLTKFDSLLFGFCIIVWSFPNYFASLPSWYNLICALIGLYFLNCYHLGNNKKFLILAGLTSGISVLFKIVGLYELAAIFFTLLYKNQLLFISKNKSINLNFTNFLVLTLVLTAYTLISLLISHFFTVSQFYHFSFPFLILSLFMCWRQLYIEKENSKAFLTSLTKDTLYTLLGFFLPIVCFLIILYPNAEKLSKLFFGLFIRPNLRLKFSTFDFIYTNLIFATSLLVSFILISNHIRSKFFKISIFLLLSFITIKSFYNISLAKVFYLLLQNSVPIITLYCLYILRYEKFSSLHKNFLFSSMTMMLWFSLIQFPFATPEYFYYSCAFIFSSLSLIYKLIPNFYLLIYTKIIGALFIGIFLINCSSVILLKPDNWSTLKINKGEIYVSQKSARTYINLINKIRELSKSEYILAMPDAPEVYFLSNKKNPTKDLYQFFNDNYTPEKIKDLIETFNINVIVLRRTKSFSKIPISIFNIIESMYPNKLTYDQFELRWL